VRGEEAVTVGDAEIRVIAGDGTWFIAPTLILHYVIEHDYRPPSSFVQALMRGVFADAAAGGG